MPDRPDQILEINWEADPFAGYVDLALAYSPLGYWRLDETSGTNLNDASPNNNDATLAGTYTLNQDSILGDGNKCISFDGSTGYGYLTAPASFRAADEWTLAALINPTAARSTDDQFAGILCVGGATGGHYPCSLMYGRMDDAFAVADCVWCGFYRSDITGGTWLTISDPTAVVLNSWHHYIATNELKDDGYYYLTLYRNGKAVAGPSRQAQTVGLATGGQFRIGRREQSVGTSDYFPGRIDEPLLLDFAIDAHEAAGLYASVLAVADKDAGYTALPAIKGVPRIRGFSSRSGRQDNVGRVEAAEATVYVDNRDDFLTPDPIVNLLKNPSFEESVTDEWSVTNGTRTWDSSIPYKGTRSCLLFSSATGDCYISAPGTAGLDLGLRPGKTYVLSAYVRMPSGQSGHDLADVLCQIGDRVSSSWQWSTIASAPGSFDTYVRVTATRTIRSTADAVEIRVGFNAGGTGANFWLRIDAVQVEEASSVTAYADGDQVGCRWHSIPHDSVTHREAESSVLANSIDNPSVETNTTNWEVASSEGTPVLSRVNLGAGIYPGNYVAQGEVTISSGPNAYLRVGPTLGNSGASGAACTASDYVFFSAWCRVTGGPGTYSSGTELRLVAYWRKSDQSFLSTTVIASVLVTEAMDDFVHLSGAAQAPVDAAWAFPQAQVRDIDYTGTYQLQADGALATKVGAAGAPTLLEMTGIIYIDGSLANGIWEGTAHASRSYLKRSYRNILVNRMARLRARYPAETGTYYPIIEGLITDFDYNYKGWGNDSLVAIKIVDGFKVLSSDSLINFVRPIESIGDRVRAVLQAAGIPADRISVNDTYIDTRLLKAVAVGELDGTSPLEYIRQIEETEAGALFYIAPDGQYTYEGRLRRTVNTPEVIIFSDQVDSTKQPYEDISIKLNDANRENEVKITHQRTGAILFATEPTSIRRYFPRHKELTSLFQDPIGLYLPRSEPLPVVEPINLEPLADPDTLWPAILGLDISNLFRLERRVTREALQGFLQYLEGIDHQVTDLDWKVTLHSSSVLAGGMPPLEVVASGIGEPIFMHGGYLSGTSLMPAYDYKAGRLYVYFVGNGENAAPTIEGFTQIATDNPINVPRMTSFYKIETQDRTQYQPDTTNSVYNYVGFEIPYGFDPDDPIGVNAFWAGSTMYPEVNAGTFASIYSRGLSYLYSYGGGSHTWGRFIEVYDQAYGSSWAHSAAYGPEGTNIFKATRTVGEASHIHAVEIQPVL